MRLSQKTSKIERLMTQGSINVIYKEVAYGFERKNGVRKIFDASNKKPGKGELYPKVKLLVPGNFKHPNWKVN